MRRFNDFIDEIDFFLKGISDEYSKGFSLVKAASVSITAMGFLFVLSVSWMPFLIAPAMAAAISVPLSMAVLRIIGAVLKNRHMVGDSPRMTRAVAIVSASGAAIINWVLLSLFSRLLVAGIPEWSLLVSALCAFIWMLVLVVWNAKCHHPQFQLIAGWW